MAASILVLCFVAFTVPAVQADTLGAVNEASTLRKTLIDELRSARQQIEPEQTTSALRHDIIAELRLAREQTEPKKPARSALRDEIIAELRSARKQSDVKEAPSALRKEIINELRSARQQVLSQEKEKVENPADSALLQQEQELPWDDEEHLLTDAVPLNKVKSVPVAIASSAMAENVVAFNRFIRTLVLYGTALGLASLAKLPELDLKTQGRSPAYFVTLALFFVPLLATSADFILDVAIGNEFAIIAGCWGLGAMAGVHERIKQQ
jgi:hypothetical protein